MNKLIRMVTAQHLVIIGLVLIVVGNSFSATFLNIRVHELIASLGALFLIVATLQWFFDENSREQLVQQIIGRVGDYLNRRDNLAEHGIASCLINSKDIADDRWQAELIGARTLAIGVQTPTVQLFAMNA